MFVCAGFWCDVGAHPGPDDHLLHVSGLRTPPLPGTIQETPAGTVPHLGDRRHTSLVDSLADRVHESTSARGIWRVSHKVLHLIIAVFGVIWEICFVLMLFNFSKSNYHDILDNTSIIINMICKVINAFFFVFFLYISIVKHARHWSFDDVP